MDFMTGLLALSFILMIYLLVWNSIVLRWDEASAQNSMASSAFLASESLLATPGEPTSWEMLPNMTGNVTAIGLVNSRNELNPLKLSQLVAYNATAYSTIKTRLGLQFYDFGLEVTDLTGGSVYYEFGKFSGPTTSNSVVIDRFGIMNGTPVIVHMEVFG